MDPNEPQQTTTPPVTDQTPVSPPSTDPISTPPEHLAGPDSSAAMQPTADSAPAAPGNAMPATGNPGKNKMVGVLLITFGIIVLLGLAYLGYTAFIKK